MQIRSAVASDVRYMSELILPLVEKYILPSCSPEGGLLLKDSMSVEKIQSYFDFDCQYSVAVDNGEIIALIGIKHHSHLYHLFVADSHRGLGYATLLWESAKLLCIEQSKTKVFTVNSAPNAAAMYKKWGFTPICGTRERSGIKDVPMQLRLD